MDKTISQGFEKFFIKNWSGWDSFDLAEFVFYNVELVPGIFKMSQTENINCAINLETMKVTVWHGKDEETVDFILAVKK